MICFRKNLFLWFALAMAFCSSAWGACVNRTLTASISCSNTTTCFCNHGSSCGGIGIGTCYGSMSCNSQGVCTMQCSNNPSTGLWCLLDNQIQVGNPYCLNSNQAALDIIECSNKCQADSVSNGGIITDCEPDVDSPTGYSKYFCPDDLKCSSCHKESCQPVDSSSCDLARQRCNKLGGVFEGHPLQDGCSSTCNTCGNSANKKILQIKSESCCAQGLAPSIEQMCQTLVQSGVGETYSTNANLECSDPSLSEEGASAYAEYCSGEYDWDEESSSSGEGTSGEGGSSSSGEGTSEGISAGTSEGLEGGDYYPILDTIRDTLNDIRDNVENIYLCLVTPSACAGLSSGKSGDTVIVNVPSDSVILKDIKSGILKLDTSSNKTITAIGVANDTLIDSMRKYLGEVSSALGEINLSFSGDTLGDSLGRIHGTLEEIKGLLDGEEVDTSGYGSWGQYVQEGESIGDSIGVASGWLGGLDTVDVDSVFASASASDSVNYDSLGGEVDSALQHRLDTLYDKMKLSVDSSRSSLIDSMDVWAETLKVYAPFADFDSLIYNAIGAKIPNKDECPDGCQKWSISLPRFGLINYTVDMGLCLGRSVFGGLSVLGFIRLLVRLVVVWTCIWFVIWNFTKKKGS